MTTYNVVGCFLIPSFAAGSLSLQWCAGCHLQTTPGACRLYSQSKTAELKGTHGPEGCLPLKIKAHNQRHIYFENYPGMAEFLSDLVWFYVCLSLCLHHLFIDCLLTLAFASPVGREKWHLRVDAVCICCVRLNIFAVLRACQGWFFSELFVCIISPREDWGHCFCCIEFLG